MFGFVTASLKELSPQERKRYCAVYCGICRRIRQRAGQLSRLNLSYDMAFLARLLMSLYEPEETGGDNACALHPINKRPWTDNVYIQYAADMNVALSYYNCLDDWQDDKKPTRKWMADHLAHYCPDIETQYPRQCSAMQDCIARLSQLEKEGCTNPDEPAACFGQLMAELLVYEEDLWSDDLREMGMALGRFIYLADAAVDYKKDVRKGKYNPFAAQGTGADWPRWEEYLVLSMARCTDYFEKLPLVQDKSLLNNILYGGVWTNFGKKRKEADDAS